MAKATFRSCGHRPQPLRLRYGEEGFERLDAGLTPEIVREISAKKDEPEWMLEFRLKSLEIYKSMSAPDWGPSIAGLDMDNIVTTSKPNTDQKSDWESLPDDVKNTFDRLGIPQSRARVSRRRRRPSTTPSSCITTCKTPPRRWASCIRASKKPCTTPNGSRSFARNS